MFGIAPFGMICGVAMVAGGIPPLVAILMSICVFAGASMLAASQLLAAGAPVALVVLTAFFINLRFMMYSGSIRLHLGPMPIRWRLLVAYLLADNPYALSMARFVEHPEDRNRLAYYLGVSVPVWVCWQVAVATGVAIGARLPAAWQLEFAAPLAFIALSVPLLRDRAMIAAAVASACTVALAHAVPLRLALILAACAGLAAGLATERKTA